MAAPQRDIDYIPVAGPRALLTVDPALGNGRPYFEANGTPAWMVLCSIAKGTSPEQAAEDADLPVHDVYLAMEALGLPVPDDVHRQLHPGEVLDSDYGPNLAEVERILHRAADVTDDEADALVQAERLVSPQARRAAYREVSRVAEQHGRTKARVAAHQAGVAAARQCFLAHWRHLDAVAGAAEAMVVADLIGDEHLRSLAGPWWSVMDAVAVTPPAPVVDRSRLRGW